MKSRISKNRICVFSLALISILTLGIYSCKDEISTNGEQVSLPKTRVASSNPLPFIKGVDLSYANELEDLGVIFYEDGTAKDVYEIMHDHGANMARIRLWHNPTSWTQYSTLADAKKSIARAKDLNMYVLLDFHYSDTWTDPQQNQIPAAWLPVVDNIPVLQDSISNYTLAVLNDLKAANLLPDWVQIGNEINKNIMVRDTTELTPVNLARNVALLNAGINTVLQFNEDNNKDIKTVLHVAMAPEESLFWVSNLIQLGISNFDIFGLSYYPQWQGYTPKDLGKLTSDMKSLYNKKLLVAETGHIWTRQWNDTLINLMSKMGPGLPEAPCPQLQKDFLIEVRNEVRNNGGVGVIAWSPEWVTANNITLWGEGSNWENVAFFDFNNQLLKPGGVDFLSEDNVEVTFRVDMTGVDVSNGVFITGEFTIGDFNEWQLFPMKHEEGSNSIYYFKTNLYPGQSGAYYFLNGEDWDAREWVPESCQGKWNDRLYEISTTASSQTITNVWSWCN